MRALSFFCTASRALKPACTQVAIDPSSGRPLKGVLRQVHLPPGPVSEIAKLADKRREDRLQDKRVLQRCVRQSFPLALHSPQCFGLRQAYSPFAPPLWHFLRYITVLNRSAATGCTPRSPVRICSALRPSCTSVPSCRGALRPVFPCPASSVYALFCCAMLCYAKGGGWLLCSHAVVKRAVLSPPPASALYPTGARALAPTGPSQTVVAAVEPADLDQVESRLARRDAGVLLPLAGQCGGAAEGGESGGGRGSSRADEMRKREKASEWGRGLRPRDEVDGQTGSMRRNSLIDALALQCFALCLSVRSPPVRFELDETPARRAEYGERREGRHGFACFERDVADQPRREGGRFFPTLDSARRAVQWRDVVGVGGRLVCFEVVTLRASLPADRRRPRGLDAEPRVSTPERLAVVDSAPLAQPCGTRARCERLVRALPDERGRSRPAWASVNGGKRR